MKPARRVNRGPLYTRLAVDQCGRCVAVTLVGIVAGVRLRIARYSITEEHARLLVHYGHGVLVVTRAAVGGLRADFWSPGGSVPAGSYLVPAHSCASHHERNRS